MVKVYLHGMTVVSIKVVITKKRNKVMVYSLGPMGANTMVNGSMANHMEKGPILIQRAKRNVANGKKERE